MTRTVLTIGTFDVPHLGHAYLFQECMRYGDRLVVGVNSDEFVEEYKGHKPVMNELVRCRHIAALGYATLINDSAGRELIQAVHPTVLCIGSDWATRDYYKQIDVDQAYLNNNGITMVYIPRHPGLSSTFMKETF